MDIRRGRIFAKVKRHVIAVDIGTTSTKALVVGERGKVLAARSIEYPLHTPEPGAAEQDPEQIFQSVVDSIRGVLEDSAIAGEDVLCVTFSSAMHSLIAVDRDGRPLTQSITWADQRSHDYAEQLKRDGTGLAIYTSTGTPIHPMSPLVKLMWMKERRPELFASAYKFIGIKEYVFFRLFGKYWVDYSIASATGLFNLQSLTWDAQALDTAGIRADRLAEPVSATFKATGLTDPWASRMGLPAETPFIIGASDGVLANLGIGVMNSNEMAVTIGTSGAVRTVVNTPTVDAQGRLFCYSLAEDHWVIGGASNNGAIVLRWILDELYGTDAEIAKREGKDPFEQMLQEAEQVPPGADGLLCLPLLTGERAPYWNSNARGVFFGLSLAHKRQHMLRAAMEGVMFQIAAISELLEQLAGKPQLIRASGGFAKSSLWCQMLADVTGIPIVIPEVVESSGLGAAQLGLYAMGATDRLVQDWGAADGRRFTPNMDHYRIYQRMLPIYHQVYEQLIGSFEQLSSLGSKT